MPTKSNLAETIDYESRAVQASLISQGLWRILGMALQEPDQQRQAELITLAEAAAAQVHYTLTGENVEEVCNG